MSKSGRKGPLIINPQPSVYGSPAGFTLIEVLISLALLTVVVGAVYSTFFSIHRAIERFDNVSLKYHEARSALDIMRREIESALLKVSPDKDRKEAVAPFIMKDRDIFGKMTSTLELTAFSVNTGVHKKISYYVDGTNGKLTLFKKESPPVEPDREYSYEVIEDIESFTVETLFLDKWVKTWDTGETNKLPDVVRVTIEFNDNGKSVKLFEYAKPKIGKYL